MRKARVAVCLILAMIAGEEDCATLTVDAISHATSPVKSERSLAPQFNADLPDADVPRPGPTSDRPSLNWTSSSSRGSFTHNVTLVLDLTPRMNGSDRLVRTDVDAITDDDTGRRRRCPQVIIIGAKKAGTRALLEFLRVHPDVRAVGPEVHFFDKNYHRGFEWYR